MYLYKTELSEMFYYLIGLFVNQKKLYLHYINCLKFNSALNDPRRIDTP